MYNNSQTNQILESLGFYQVSRGYVIVLGICANILAEHNMKDSHGHNPLPDISLTLRWKK